MRQKKISKEEYIKLFCPDKRIRDRMVIYVNSETHRKMRMVASLFSKQHVTTSSLTDAILSHHLSLHKDLLNQIIKEDNEDFREWMHNLKGHNKTDAENDTENEIENAN